VENRDQQNKQLVVETNRCHHELHQYDHNLYNILAAGEMEILSVSFHTFTFFFLLIGSFNFPSSISIWRQIGQVPGMSGTQFGSA
jgi:hypothetical protein